MAEACAPEPAPASECAQASTSTPRPKARGEWRQYKYSVLRYTPKASMHDEEVNIGVIVADHDARTVHRRLIAEEDIKRRNAEGLLPCPVLDALDAAACGNLDGSGNPVAALERLHAEYGRDRGDIMRVTKPRYLHLPTHDHSGAVDWMYETTLTRSRELSEAGRKQSMSGIEHPDNGEYWFSSIQYVPDAIRDEGVNVGLAVANKATGRTIVRYVQGEDREMLGQGRFDGLWHIHPYERKSSVDDTDEYLRGIAKPDISCVQCTEPRAASGRGPEEVADRLYTRLVAHAPHHDGARLSPCPRRRA